MPDEPSHRVLGAWNGGPWRYERARNHKYGKPECPGRFDLGDSGVPARVLCQDGLYPVFFEEANVGLRGEWAARLKDLDIWQSEGHGRPVDHADDISMLRGGLELRQCKASYAAEHSPGHIAERGDRLGNGRYFKPVVSLLAFPCRPFDGDKGDSRLCRGVDGVSAHPACEGMRRVNQYADALFVKIVGEAGGAAEAADPCCDGLNARRSRSAGKRKHCVEARVVGEKFRKRARFGRAAQEEDAHGWRF